MAAGAATVVVRASSSGRRRCAVTHRVDALAHSHGVEAAPEARAPVLRGHRGDGRGHAEAGLPLVDADIVDGRVGERRNHACAAGAHDLLAVGKAVAGDARRSALEDAVREHLQRRDRRDVRRLHDDATVPVRQLRRKRASFLDCELPSQQGHKEARLERAARGANRQIFARSQSDVPAVVRRRQILSEVVAVVEIFDCGGPIGRSVDEISDRHSRCRRRRHVRRAEEAHRRRLLCVAGEGCSSTGRLQLGERSFGIRTDLLRWWKEQTTARTDKKFRPVSIFMGLSSAPAGL